jgi:hypothetical protein
MFKSVGNGTRLDRQYLLYRETIDWMCSLLFDIEIDVIVEYRSMSLLSSIMVFVR